MKNRCLAFFGMLSIAVFSQENPSNKDLKKDWTSGRPDGHAPISVMGDHMHHKGEWMVSYRFMAMEMSDLRFENEDVGNNFVFQNYMVAPREMTMNMHMVGVMYAPSNKITLMAMANFESSKMSLKSKMGMDMKMETEGIGDFSLSVLYRIFNKNGNALHAQVGVVFPTGSIDETGTMKMMGQTNEMVMAYPMQIGSGSYSTKLGLTYLWQAPVFSGGVQATSLIRLNENNRSYRLGNKYGLTSWMAIKTTNFLSFSLRGDIGYTEKTTGKDLQLNPMMTPTADIQNSGGLLANVGLGANFYISKNTLKGLRFGLEANLPVYQEPNGVQLKHDYVLTFGTQYSF